MKFAVLPSFTSTPSNLTVREDSEAIFLCTATGNPTPTIKWMKDGKIVGQGDELRFSAKRNQSGEYRCSADNGLGVNITASASLDVQCKLHNTFVNFGQRLDTSVMQTMLHAKSSPIFI